MGIGTDDSGDARRSIWARVEQDLSERSGEAAGINIWEIAAERLNPAKYRPVGIDNVEVADVTSDPLEKRYMLRNPGNNKYVTLGERELFLWNLMDGQNTLKDLILEYFARYGTIGQETLFTLLGLLKANGFLKTKPAPMMQTLSARLQGHKPLLWLISAVASFLSRDFTSKRADGYFDWLYRRVAHPLYTRIGFATVLLFVTADLALFAYYVLVRSTPLMSSHQGGAIYDVVAMMLATYVGIGIHEHAHGLSVKAYGRKVLRGGIMLYYGSPVWFVDTTDIWMRSRFPRVVVSFAGPCSNGVLGGVLFLISLALPEGTLRALLIQAAVLNTLLFVINLVPIAETDGHYIIQDYSGIPRLRPTALGFVRRGMWQKLARREHWARNDFFLLAYGLISLAGTGFSIYVGVSLWMSTVAPLLRAVLSNPLILAEVFGILVLFAIIAEGVYMMRTRVRRRRYAPLASGRGMVEE